MELAARVRSDSYTLLLLVRAGAVATGQSGLTALPLLAVNF
jgi:hypothetical protein